MHSSIRPFIHSFIHSVFQDASINAHLAADCTAMRSLLADAAVFDAPDRLHTLVLDGVLTGRTLLDVLASLALLFRARLVFFLYTGHGCRPTSGFPAALQFREGMATVGAVQLAPLLRACRAKNTLVVLDCCHSTGIFHNIGFPGLAVVPACGNDQVVSPGLTRNVLVPVLRGVCDQYCSMLGCSECRHFRAIGRARVWPLIEHLRHHFPVGERCVCFGGGGGGGCFFFFFFF
mgnify:CR=1 FL=1